MFNIIDMYDEYSALKELERDLLKKMRVQLREMNTEDRQKTRSDFINHIDEDAYPFYKDVLEQ